GPWTRSRRGPGWCRWTTWPCPPTTAAWSGGGARADAGGPGPPDGRRPARRCARTIARPRGEDARMITRRDYLKLSAMAGVALAISPTRLLADDSPRSLITRAIPGTTEQLPVVGLGSSASFSRVAGERKSTRLNSSHVKISYA